MINYTSWPIILSNMKAIGPMTLEELHWQSEAGQTNGKTICPQTIALEDNWYVWFNDEWWCHLSDCYVQRWMMVSFEWLLCSTMNDGVIWVIVMFNDEWWCHLSDCYVQWWCHLSDCYVQWWMMVSFEWLLCSMMNDDVIWVIVMFNDEWWCHLSDCYVQWWMMMSFEWLLCSMMVSFEWLLCSTMNDDVIWVIVMFNDEWWCHLSDCYVQCSMMVSFEWLLCSMMMSFEWLLCSMMVSFEWLLSNGK
jgi:hypothetical protein